MISVACFIDKKRATLAGLRVRLKSYETVFINHIFFKKEEDKEELLSEALKKVAREYKLETLKFVFSLPEDQVTNFHLELPFKEKFRILKTLNFEIEDKTPFEASGVFYDTKLCKVKGKKSFSVCFLSPKKQVQEFLEFQKKLKTPLNRLSCTASALPNLLGGLEKEREGEAFYSLFLGLSSSLLFSYQEGGLKSVRSLEFGVEGIVQDMKKAYSLKEDEALDEFFEKAFVLNLTKGRSKDQIFYSNLVKKHLEILISKLRLLKLRSSQKDTPLFLFGPGASIKNLSSFLTKNLPLTCKKIPQKDMDLKVKDPLSFEALALSMEALKKAPHTGLNLIHSQVTRGFSLFPKVWLKRLSLVFAFSFIVGAYGFVRKKEISGILTSSKKIIEKYKDQVGFLPKGEVLFEEIKEALDKEKTKLEKAKQASKSLQGFGALERLQILTQKLGSANMWSLKISVLDIKKDRVEIKGMVREDLLPQLKSRLESLSETPLKEKTVANLPDQITLPGLDKESPTRTSFSYSFKLKDIE